MSKVSILMPNFNKGPFIEEAVRSVMNQIYTDWELIVVDDGSTDGSRQILESWATTDERIKVVFNENNMGGNASRNKALAAATGDCVLFLDSDDLLAPFCLEQRISAASRDSDAEMWVFPMAIFKEVPGDMSTEFEWIPKEGNQIKKFMSHRLPWQTMQPLWRISFLRTMGGFDPEFVRLQDVELHTRALLTGVHFKVYPTLPADCFFRTDDGRLTGDMFGFLNRFSLGAIQYYKKYYPKADARQKRWLSGTLLETVGNVLARCRQGLINQTEKQELIEALVITCQRDSHRFILRVYAALDGLSPVHPRGLKKLIGVALGLF